MQTTKLGAFEETDSKAFLIHPAKNKVVELKEFTTLGRGDSNHIKLEDPFVSQRHARIEKKGDQFIVKDLRSSNGTFLNETQVMEAKLQRNDQVRLGESTWIFSFSPEGLKNTSFASKNRDWQSQLERLPAFAATDHTVLIVGPSGSGKEVIAREVHKHSHRKNHPLVAINCSALSPQLIESELFGHIKGSFTGAAEDRQGAFESARGGTLFLDEIGDLPLHLQPKLLRALENNEIRPVGSDKTIKTDVRVVAATHKNLYEQVLSKQFREDLYHRLNVCRVSTPSLLDRMEDFESLLYDFARNYKVRFSFAAIETLKDHSWPGNVRELKNTVIRASAYYPGQQIEKEHLKEILVTPTAAPLRSLDHLPPLKQLEKDLIVNSLEKHNGNQRQAAEDLKMPKSTFHDKIKSYGLNPVSFKKRGRV